MLITSIGERCKSERLSLPSYIADDVYQAENRNAMDKSRVETVYITKLVRFADYSAIFCGTWTALQAPSLNVPGFAGEVS